LTVPDYLTITVDRCALAVKSRSKRPKEGSEKQYPFHAILHPASYFPPDAVIALYLIRICP
jgi:hypothetical protein